MKGKKRKDQKYSPLLGGGGVDQLSFDKYIVSCSFLSRIQRDIYHCSCGKEGRKRGGWRSPVLRHIMCVFFNPYYFLSLGKNTLPPFSYIHLGFLCFSFISPFTLIPLSSILALITLRLLTTLLLKWIMKQKYVKFCHPPQLWQQKVTTSGREL